MAKDIDGGAVWRRNAISAVIIIALTWAAAIYRPDKALRVAVGLTAHDICEAVFVTGRDPDIAFREGIAPRPGYRLIARFMHYDVNRDKGVVQAWIGGVRRNAAYTPGRGCLLLIGGAKAPRPFAPEPASLPILPDIAGPQVVEPQTPALKGALDALFAEADPKHPRQVKAAVVLAHGRIVAERYAQGYGVDTPINGWSASKSIMSAMVGILVRDGKLKVDQPAPIPKWRTSGDPHGGVTIDHLLRMTSGLSVDEDNSGFDVSSQVLYNERDMVLASIHQRMLRKPGTAFRYGSPQTLILARIVENQVGGTPEGFMRLARRELFEPLGMSHVTIETDAAGTPIMSSYVSAPARSWARFGQLYLHDGMIGKVRILPVGWVDYSRRATLGENYGAGFWTNATPAPEARARIAAGMPADTFFASGAMGQRVYIMPSRDVVIVRMGLTPDGDFGIREDIAFIRSVLAALPSAAPT